MGTGRFSAIGTPSIGYSLPDKIRIGHLTPLTGFLGTSGAYAQLGIRLAEAELRRAEQFLTTEKRLFEKGLHPRSQVDVAESKVQQARIAIEQAQRKKTT